MVCVGIAINAISAPVSFNVISDAEIVGSVGDAGRRHQSNIRLYRLPFRPESAYGIDASSAELALIDERNKNRAVSFTLFQKYVATGGKKDNILVAEISLTTSNASKYVPLRSSGVSSPKRSFAHSHAYISCL